MTEEAKNNEAIKNDLPAVLPDKQPTQFIGLDKTEKEAVPAEEVSLRDLVEKNLKWLQIIYEQNRRISRHLLWSTFFSWFKWVILICVLAWGAWYAWPTARDLLAQYQAISRGVTFGQTIDQSTLDKILKMIPLNDAEKEQIKAMNK